MLNNTSYDICTIHNIDTEDFVFEYDRSSGNYPYVIPAGEIKRFPRFLASHALKHLIDKILTKNNIKINNGDARKDLASQIVIEEEKFQPPAQKSEAEKIHKQVEELNRPSELDAILAKRKPSPTSPEVTPEVSTGPTSSTTSSVEEKFEGLDTAPLEPDPDDVGSEVDTTDPEPEPVKKETPSIPTRREIYNYAKSKLGMVLDKTTTKKFDKMKIEDLLTEVGDPREALK